LLSFSKLFERKCNIEGTQKIFGHFSKKIGSYFSGGKDSRPSSLLSISIKNRVTPDTRIRISILKLMAKRYRDSNAGSRVQVIGYDPRPLLKITPPVGASDRRTKVFNYIEACRSLPTTFDAADLDPILRRVSPKLHGQIKATFIVLSDDMKRSGPRATRPAPGSVGPTDDASSGTGSESNAPDPDHEGFVEVGPRRGVRRHADSPPGSPSAKR